MRRTLLKIGIVTAVAFLGIPMIGYATMETPGMSVNVALTAQCASASSFNHATYTCSFTADQGGKPSYWSYVGTFWGSRVNTNSLVINYPTVSIAVLDKTTYERMVPDQYFDYTWDQTWTHTIKVPANPSQHIYVQVQIFASQGNSMGYQGFDYTVPSITAGMS